MSPLNSLLLSLALVAAAQAFSNCGTSSQLVGCIACANGFTLSLNLSDNLYTCINTPNCIAVQQAVCSECASPYVYDAGSDRCSLNEGCVTLNGSTLCLECNNQSYSLKNGFCVLNDIEYCSVYSASQLCSLCEYEFMDPASNCSVSPSFCLDFDYPTWKCLQCPANTVLHQEATHCVSAVANCVRYGAAGCVLCERGFVLLANACSVAAYTETLLDGNYYRRCLDRNQQLLNQACSAVSNHCVAENSLTWCLTCLDGYYLSGNACFECSTANCFACSNMGCTVCERGYYLSSSTCLSCSVYGCEDCINSNGTVQCVQCALNATLYAGACFECGAGSSFSIQDKKCLACSIANCSSCSVIYGPAGKQETCRWCMDGYYLDNSVCSVLTASATLSTSNALEILSKALPGSEPALKSKSALMKVCPRTNGYVCECGDSTATSVCASYVYEVDVSGLFATLTCEQLRQHADIVRMSAELPTFSHSMPADCLMSEHAYWNVLSAYTFQLQRGTNRLTSLYAEASSMRNVFSEETVTILTGNGFYYKYKPRGVSSGDDGFINASIADSWTLFFVFFDRVPSQDQLTGKVHVFTDSSSPFSVQTQTVGQSGNIDQFQVYREGSLDSTASVSMSAGILTISNFGKSTASSLAGLQVLAAAESTEDAYVLERIEYIFWNESFIYILVFLAMYLVFIPLCSIVDCCRGDILRRKRIDAEEESAENKDSEQMDVVKVNYRDFFPLYNIGNTPRPRRLLKLCLFLLNCQHGVTFLTLAYFNLAADSEIVAVVLAIPCYLGTVLLGYVCGLLVKYLPSFTKYFINLLALGYWVLWVVLMRRFASAEYKLYVLVFALIFLALDLVVDCLETLLVYFVIKQEDRQVSFLRCIAKWLSFRGFYEFDRLAKDITD